MISEQDLLIKLENDRYYILASSSYADDRTRVLNSGNTFAIFDRWGDIKQLGTGVQGLYHEGTRYISEMQLSISGQRPALLSSNVKDENEVLSIDLTNPRMAITGGDLIDKGVLHISRTKFLIEGVCHERITFHNYDVRELVFDCKFSFEGDFKDIFEVRGIVRQRRGKMNEPEIIGKDTMRITYAGLDNEERTAWIRFTADMNWDAQSATRKITLPPGQREEISYSIQCTSRQSVEPLLNYEEALGQVFANIRKKKNFISDIS